jgi:hypothetical protein
MSNIIAIPLNKLTRSARNVRKSGGEGQALRLFQPRGLTYSFFTNGGVTLKVLKRIQTLLLMLIKDATRSSCTLVRENLLYRHHPLRSRDHIGLRKR